MMLLHALSPQTIILLFAQNLFQMRTASAQYFRTRDNV